MFCHLYTELPLLFADKERFPIPAGEWTTDVAPGAHGQKVFPRADAIAILSGRQRFRGDDMQTKLFER